MRYLSLEEQKDLVLMVARVLLMLLFIVYGWQKLAGFSGTVAYMTSMGSTVPRFTATIAVVMELVVGMAILVGFFTRPLALLLAFYTLCTAVIGYDYSMMQGMEHYANLINLYKSISIVGALFLLCVTGPGKFSFDRK